MVVAVSSTIVRQLCIAAESSEGAGCDRPLRILPLTQENNNTVFFDTDAVMTALNLLI